MSGQCHHPVNLVLYLRNFMHAVNSECTDSNLNVHPTDTRTGLKLDSKDPRSKSFLYLMHMLPKMKNPPKYILVENVKGFDVGLTNSGYKDEISRLFYLT